MHLFLLALATTTQSSLFEMRYFLYLELILVLGSVCATAARRETNNYDGVLYDHVYPYIDVTQDQRNCSVTENETCPLFIALMMSFGGEFDSSSVIPGVQIAIDQINSDPTMLPGYTLHYVLKKTMCETHGVVAMDALHTHLLQSPTKVGIIGSGCSLATEPTAQVSQYYNVTHISCVSSSTELSNRDRFRYHFQLLATEADLAIGFYSIIMKFKWRRVNILLQEEGLFEGTINRLVDMLEESNVQTLVTRFSSTEGIAGLGEEPFHQDYRIFLFAMYSSHARRLLCKAFEQDIHYPRHEFLFYGWYAEGWWKQDDGTLQCSAKDRESVIGPALSPLLDEFVSNCSKEADSGINGFQFVSDYEAALHRSRGPPLSVSGHSVYAQQCYDATWTMARALNLTLKDIKGDSKLNEKLKRYESDPSYLEFGLQHFTYNNSGVLEVVYGYLSQINFSGITGNVTFGSSDGVRHVPRIIVSQYRPSNLLECFVCSCSNTSVPEPTIRRELVASVNQDDASFDLFIDEDSLWTDGVPYDGVPQNFVERIHTAVTVVFCLLSTAGIVFAIACLYYNYTYRDKKLIKLSSPNLNYLIVIGAIILYVDVYLFVIPTESRISAVIICNLTPWMTAIGYSLCYGTIIVKMFRIFYIIQNLFSKNRFLKDWVLALAVAVLISIDIFILSVFTIVEVTRGSLTAVLESNDENFMSLFGPTEIILQNKFYICDSKSRDITLGILYGYKALVQVIALIFSFSMTKVKIKGLNDAKHIIIAVYVTSIVTAVIFVSLYTLKTYLNLYSILFSFGFFVGTTVILALVFLPKMIALYRDPECKSVVIKLQAEDIHCQKTEDTVKHLVETENVVTMRKKIKELESHIRFQQGQLKTFTEKSECTSCERSVSPVRDTSLSKRSTEVATSMATSN